MANPIDNGPRVPGSGVSGSGRTQSVQPGKSREAESREAAAPAVDERVESERLQQVREKVDNTPEVDMDRVEAIKQAIAEGRYPLDPQRIAQKFVELEGLLNG